MIKGNKEQIIKAIPDVKPGHHYIITFAVKSATGGYVDPKHISIDTSVTVEHLGYTVDMDETILDSSDRPNGDYNELRAWSCSRTSRRESVRRVASVEAKSWATAWTPRWANTRRR